MLRRNIYERKRKRENKKGKEKELEKWKERKKFIMKNQMQEISE